MEVFLMVLIIFVERCSYVFFLIGYFFYHINWMQFNFNILCGVGFAVLEPQRGGRNSYPLPDIVLKPRFKYSLYQQHIDQGVTINKSVNILDFLCRK